jgi:hypothetical protein
VRREQSARHGSTESSGAETVKDGVSGNSYNGDSFMNPMRDRSVHLFFSRLLCATPCLFSYPDLPLRIPSSRRDETIHYRLASVLDVRKASIKIPSAEILLRPVLEHERQKTNRVPV